MGRALVVVAGLCWVSCASAALFATPHWSRGPAAKQQDQGRVYTCDEIAMSEQCELELQTGSVAVRDLDIAFYVYTPKGVAVPSSRPSLVVVNGGPGASHTYTLPTKFVACNGHRVVFYDQAGTGASGQADNITLTHPYVMQPSYYVDELRSVVDAAAGNAAAHVVMGHSWGGMVALLYGLAKPPGLRGLVLSSTLSDSQLYVTTQRSLLHPTLPPFLYHRLMALESAQAYDTPEYAALSEHLTSLWTVRLFPMPDCVLEGLTTLNAPIYIGMQGHSEFTIGGVLEHFNVTGALGRIGVPALVTYGEHDTVTNATAIAIRNGIPKSRLVRIPRSGHMTMVDNTPAYNSALRRFLSEVETGTFQADPDYDLDTGGLGAGPLRIIMAVGLILLVMVAVFFRLNCTSLRGDNAASHVPL